MPRDNYSVGFYLGKWAIYKNHDTVVMLCDSDAKAHDELSKLRTYGNDQAS